MKSKKWKSESESNGREEIQENIVVKSTATNFSWPGEPIVVVFLNQFHFLLFIRAGHTLVKNLKSLRISGSDLLPC